MNVLPTSAAAPPHAASAAAAAAEHPAAYASGRGGVPPPRWDAAAAPTAAAAASAEMPSLWREEPCVVLSIAEPHVVLCANAAWLRAFGFDAMHDAVLGKTLRFLVVGSRTEIVLENLLHFCCLFPDGGVSCAAIQLTLYDAAREEVPVVIELTHCRAQCFEHTAPKGAVLLVAMHLSRSGGDNESMEEGIMAAAEKPREAAPSFDATGGGGGAAKVAAGAAALPRALLRDGGSAASSYDPRRGARLRPAPQQLRAFLPSALPALIITRTSPAIIIAANEAWTHFFSKANTTARARAKATATADAATADASTNDENIMMMGAPPSRPKSLRWTQQQLDSVVGHSVHCIGGVLQEASDLKKIEGRAANPAWGSSGETRLAIARPAHYPATPHPHPKSSSAAGWGWLCVTQFGFGDSANAAMMSSASAAGGAKQAVGSSAAAAAASLDERFQLAVVRRAPFKPASPKDEEKKQRRREAQARYRMKNKAAIETCITLTAQCKLEIQQWLDSDAGKQSSSYGEVAKQLASIVDHRTRVMAGGYRRPPAGTADAIAIATTTTAAGAPIAHLTAVPAASSKKRKAALKGPPKKRCKRPSGDGQFVKRQELNKVKDALVVLCNQVRRLASSEQ